MRIIAFITDLKVVRKILGHLRRPSGDRAPPHEVVAVPIER
ncbi:MAG: hypothetical protein U0166_01480 [Acidobacteriota bacterium]